LIDRLKKAAVYGAILAVAGVFALAAAACALFGLLSLFLDEPWAATLTALIFAIIFFAVAQTQKPPKKAARKQDEAEGGESHNRLADAAGLASHLPAQLVALAKKHPSAAIGVGALAAVIMLRRPAIALMAATHLFGLGRPKSRWDRAREWLPF
jgi:hypothetical protein